MKFNRGFFALPLLGLVFDVLLMPMPAMAAYPGSTWNTQPLGISVASCLADAERFFVQQGFSEILPSSNIGYKGHTDTARAYILCISRPGDGTCEGEGSTAVFFIAGEDNNERKLFNDAFSAFNFSVVIDCG